MKNLLFVGLLVALIVSGCGQVDPTSIPADSMPTSYVDIQQFHPVHFNDKFTPIEYSVVVYDPIENNGIYEHWFSVECAVVDDTELFLAQVGFDFDTSAFEYSDHSFNPTSTSSMAGWAWAQSYYPHFNGYPSSLSADFNAHIYIDQNADPGAAFIDDSPNILVKFCLTTENENDDPNLTWNTQYTLAASTSYVSLPYSTSIGE